MNPKCPNCKEEASPAGKNAKKEPVFECTNPKKGCKGLQFVEYPNHTAHIEPSSLHIFFKASQK